MERCSELKENLHWLSHSDCKFAESLLSAARNRGLSEKQAYWIGALCDRVRDAKDAAAAKSCNPAGCGKNATTHNPTFPKIVALLAHAASHLKYPKMVFRGGELTIRLVRASEKSRHKGYIFVNSNEENFADRTIYGKINTEGEFSGVMSSEPNYTKVVQLLEEIEKDPTAAAAEYGKLTGNCCFCLLSLSDPRSTAVGYGKVCADHYGLPWN